MKNRLKSSSLKPGNYKLFFLVLTVAIFLWFLPVYAATEVTATPVSDNQIDLHWSWVSGSVVCNIYRDGSGTPVKSININRDREYLSYSDTALSAETEYSYKLDFVDGNGSVVETASVSAKTGTLLKPDILSWSFNINPSEGSTYAITLRWKSNSLNATGAVIKSGDGVDIFKVSDLTKCTVNGVSTVTFQDTFADVTKPVQYRIVSCDNADRTSPVSDPVTITPVTAPSVSAVMNNGVCTINWENTIGIENFYLERSAYTSNSWGSWQALSTVISPGLRSVTDSPDLPGVYRYQLHAKTTSAYTGVSNISNPVVKPAAPQGLTCTILGGSSIKLDWTNDIRNVAVLRVERKTGTGEYMLVAELDKLQNTFTDNYNFIPGTVYTYRVTAYDSVNNKASSNSFAVPFNIPANPAGLIATVYSSYRLELAWTDNSSNETAFKIERKTDSGAFAEIASTSANVTSYEDTGVTSGHSYTYRVRSYNIIGYSSGYSNEITVTPSTVYTPGSLSANSVSPTQIDLWWNYPGSRNMNTFIERRTKDGGWSVIGSQPAGANTFSDKGLTPYTQYFYRIRGFFSGYIYSAYYPSDPQGFSSWTKLDRPLNFRATSLSYGMILLTWADTVSETEYVLERKKDSSSYSVIATLPAGSISWIDSTVSSGSIYTYRLKARNQSVSSDYSDEAGIMAPVLQAPSNLSATVTSNTEVTLTWADNSSDEAGFEIWKRINNGSWLKLGAVGRNICNYTDRNLVSDNQYSYKVRSYISPDTLVSSFTDEVRVMVGKPSVPQQFKAEAVSFSQVLLTWSNSGLNTTGYKVERKVPGGIFTEIGQIGNNVLFLSDKGLLPDSTYIYRIRAYNSNGYSDYSQEQLVRTKARISYQDISQVPWAKDAIEDLATRGIIKGVSSTQYAPNKTISRAEFVSLLIRTFKLDKINSTIEFADVKPGKWYFKELSVAKLLGIITGDKDDKYSPERPITREEMAIVIYKTLNVVGKQLPKYETNILDKFKDKGAITSEALEGMASLNGEGIMKGRSDGTIGPHDNATRAESAVMIYRIIDR